jgi:hypothetical protein
MRCAGGFEKQQKDKKNTGLLVAPVPNVKDPHIKRR